MALLKFPLYHGTSTLFLESIAEHGLGGRDPIKDLRVLEFARRLLPFAESRLPDSSVLPVILSSFRRMTEQAKGKMNFQHGQSYLAPALSTAVRYAVNKPKGSELISYTLQVLDELVKLGEEEVRRDLYQEFPEIFRLLDIQATPVLIRVDEVDDESLLAESGDPPGPSLQLIKRIFVEHPDLGMELCQQENFRLTEPVPASRLTAYLIAVRRYDPFTPDYRLFPVPLTSLPAPHPWHHTSHEPTAD